MKLKNGCVVGVKVALLTIAVASLVGCGPDREITFDDQLRSWNKKVEAELGLQPVKWSVAYGVVQNANPVCKNDWETCQLKEWRLRWERDLKARYMNQVIPEVNRIRDMWVADGKLNLVKGDQARQALLKRMSNDIPMAMNECVKVADMQIGSDRNIARMKVAIQGFMGQVEACDLNGGPASIKKLNALDENFKKKVCPWHGKIDELMKKLAEEDVLGWYPVRPATYKRDSIAALDSLQDEFIRQYNVKRWNVLVCDRRNDYKKVKELTASGRISEARQILAMHDQLVKPEGLAGVSDFDDPIERAQVASGDFARKTIKTIVTSGLEGVQYHRRTRSGIGRGLYSLLVVGRAPIDDTNCSRRQAIRKAFKVARIKAEGEYSKFLETFIDSLTENDIDYKDGETIEQFKEHLKQVSKRTVSNMALVARTADAEETCVVLGWRNPEVSNIVTDDDMEEYDGIEISPSVGAYL